MSKKTIIINYIILSLLFVLNIFASIYFIRLNNTESIFEENILKVVEIKSSNDELTWGFATGFFVDKNGTILTNKHVVFNKSSNANYNKIQVRLANVDEWLDAKVVKVSELEDLATIKIDKKNTACFKMGKSINNGQKIYTIGNPNGFGLSFTTGVISSSERDIVYNEKTIRTMQTSLVINEGNSGGPVFDGNGNLLGIISFRLKDKNCDVIQGVSFALPFLTINFFLHNK